MPWNRLIDLVRSKYPIEIGDYYTTVYTDPGWYVWISLVGAGDLQFLEILGPLGPVGDFDLGRAFHSTNEKLCGLAVVDGRLTAKLVVPLRGFDPDDWSWPFQIMNVWLRSIPQESLRS